MRLALLLFLLAAGSSSSGCRRTVVHTSSTVVTTPDTLIAGTVIRTPGTWSAHHATGSRKLDVTISGNSVSWSVTSEEKLPGGGTGGGSNSSGMNLSSPSAPWFVYVESPSRLWFFNGKDQLTYNLSDRGTRTGPAISGDRLLPITEKIPPDLIPHLPPELQKLFPPVTPEEKRPSY